MESNVNREQKTFRLLFALWDTIIIEQAWIKAMTGNDDNFLRIYVIFWVLYITCHNCNDSLNKRETRKTLTCTRCFYLSEDISYSFLYVNSPNCFHFFGCGWWRSDKNTLRLWCDGRFQTFKHWRRRVLKHLHLRGGVRQQYTFHHHLHDVVCVNAFERVLKKHQLWENWLVIISTFV